MWLNYKSEIAEHHHPFAACLGVVGVGLNFVIQSFSLWSFVFHLSFKKPLLAFMATSSAFGGIDSSWQVMQVKVRIRNIFSDYNSFFSNIYACYFVAAWVLLPKC